ncbi:MAG: oligosaccharide flippase family protein [Pseudomonadales bacterium]|nr:oligosaccharide flippase family protein [Pseudomonadales bacterium]
MSIKRNTIANYIGQSYSILIGLVITPLYLQYLGAEAYGLVGIFALMQAWLQLLDLGLSPTLARQAAYARGQNNGFEHFKKLLRSFELIFVTLAVTIALAVYLTSDWVAAVWIKAETISFTTLVYCIGLMGVMIGLRWFASLYRSGINGMEDQIWLNVVTIILSSLRFIGGLILLIYFTQDVQHFFLYQLVIGICELLVFFCHFYRKLPTTRFVPGLLAFDWVSVKSVLPFTLGIAYSSAVWILLVQTDKLVLSGILSLADFGYFSLVALVAGGITVLSGPISQAIMPRMTLLVSQGKLDDMLLIYRQASQIVLLISLSVSLIIGLYAEQILFAWTGDRAAAAWGDDVLIWFALGNGILAIGAFQYYLQNAFGYLKLHVIGSTVSAVIQLPIIYFSAVHYGALGAGIAWFWLRLIWFLCWTPIVHRRFIPGFHLEWLRNDILPICMITTILAMTMNYLIPLDIVDDRLTFFSKMILMSLFLMVMASFCIARVRMSLLEIVKKALVRY